MKRKIIKEKKKDFVKSVKRKIYKNEKSEEKEKETSFSLSNDKKVSLKLTKKVKTGIVNFDKMIGGGFERLSTNIIVGGSGSGKTIFSTQCLVEGLKMGETCLYVTFEEKKEQFYENMKKFGWDLEFYEKKGKFIFLEYSPIKVKTMLEEGGGSIETTILEKRVSRIVIDSITSFGLLFEDELSKREAALDLFNMIKRWNCTSFLTVEEEPKEDKKTGTSKSLEFESDSIILLYFIRQSKERQRFIEVLKMRGTNHSRKIYDFDISKKGILISKTCSINKSDLR